MDRYTMHLSREADKTIISSVKNFDPDTAEVIMPIEWVKYSDVEKLEAESKIIIAYNLRLYKDWENEYNRAEDIQCKLDALMFEYCPEDMTKEQLREFEDAQVSVTLENKDG